MFIVFSFSFRVFLISFRGFLFKVFSFSFRVAVTPWSAGLMGLRASQAARWSAGSRAAREATVGVMALLSSRDSIEGRSRLATMSRRSPASWCSFDGDWVRTM